MGDLVARLRLEGPKLWRQLSLVQKGSLVVVALSAVVAIYFLMDWSQKPEYSTVFSGLSDSDASAVVAKLKELKVSYQLADGGSTVRVPSAQMYDVRLQLASAGLPKGGSVGFELFDKMSFGLTDFAQKLNYQRGLEGELARTIGKLAGVEEARVHVVLPQEELFVEKENPVTASVVVRLKPGADLDTRQIRGIVNLVSRSVEGLKPANVTVLDGNGVALSGEDDGSLFAIGQTGQQRDVQLGYERALQRDIQAMLEQVLGPRKAVVRVSAAFDWDRYESSSETYSPAGKPNQVRSAREVTEKSSTPPIDASTGVPTYPLTGMSPAGPVSPDATPTEAPPEEGSDQPAAVATVTATTKTDWGYERREATTNYEVSKTIEKTIKSPGALKKLSVAVLLDGQLDEGLVSTVTKGVTAAAGLDETRGDSVVVATLPFDQSVSIARDQAGEETTKRELYMDIARGALVAVSILVVLLLVRSLIRGLTREPGQLLTSRAANDSKRLASRGQHPQLAAAPVIAIKPPVTEEELRRMEIQREIASLAKSEPKLVAQIVKSWLDER